MKTFVFLSVALALVAFSYAQDSSNASPRFDANLLTVQGNGNAIVPANRTTFTVTLYGFGPNATSAQQALLLQISNIQTALSNFSLLNLQAGGIMYYPYYGSELGAAAPTSNTSAGRNLTGFVASTTLSFSLNATDAAIALDALMLNGTSYISISSRPDPLAIEEAQRLAVQMAVDDAVRKAQTALSRLGLCTLNITLINIESPISLLPAVNIVSNNFGVSLGGNFGLNMPFGGGATESVDFSQQPQQNSANSINSAAGTGRSLISAHVWLSLYHTSCGTAGAIQDLTATIPQNNAAPGSQLGSILIGSSLPLATPSSEFLGSPSEASEVSSPLASSEILGSPSEFSPSEASPLSASELSSESGSGSAIGQVRRRRSFW